ncbi:MAG: hypothetical protein IK044_06010 [Methanobrevibacter sp.]|nr:hypothetical protein [Methanobrevibacter sp.]
MAFGDRLKKAFGRGKNFKYLDDLIHRGVKEIILDSDIVLSNDEESGYLEGIKLDVDDLVIDGNGHSIDAGGKTRIFHSTSKNITIKNIEMKNGHTQKDGGAIYCRDGDLTIIASKLTDNIAKYAGGSIYIKNAKLEIVESVLANNNSKESVGGSISNENGELVINACEFQDNRADGGGALYNSGEISINNSTFTANAAKEKGGAVYNQGKLDVNDSTLQDNRAKSGGAISNHDGEVIITSSTLQSNVCEFFGGALFNHKAAYADKGKVSVISSLIIANVADDGGAIYSYGNDLKVDKCEVSANMSLKNIIFNEGFLEVYNTKLNTNRSAYVLVNECMEYNVSIVEGEFIDNDAEAVILNNGKSCTVKKTLFSNDSLNEIINKTDLTLISPEINDSKTIMNDGHISIYQSQGLESKIHGEGIVETDIIPDDDNLDFTDLDELIHNTKSEEIILEHDVVLANHERFFYEGGIELDIDNLVIDGNGHTIEGADKSRIFIITGDNITLKNLTFKNGCQPDTYHYPFNISGGAIKIINAKGLTVEKCEFTDNASPDNGGAIFNSFGELELVESELTDNAAENHGGGIYNNGGVLDLIESVLRDNMAENYGGGICNVEGELEISGSALHNNNANYGGGAYNKRGDVNIADSTLHSNNANYAGGAIYNGKGCLNISGSSFNDNHTNDGGAIENHDGVVSVDASILTRNAVKSHGGAIHNNGGKFSLTESKLTGNVANDGGAIDNYNYGEFEVLKSILATNEVNDNGGAICNNGELVIVDSTLQENHTYHNGGAISNEGKLRIESSVFLSNISEIDGGAIYNTGDLNIVDSALTGNIANCSGGLGSGGGAVCNFVWADYSFNIENCELKDNEPDDIN